MEKKRKTFLKEYTENLEIRELFKRVITLPFIDTNYIKEVFDKIKLNLEGLSDKIKEFLQYFQNQFLAHYPLQYWSYYKQYSLRTNNSCESYNKVINSYFVKKPIFWKLLYILRQEMSTVEKN